MTAIGNVIRRHRTAKNMTVRELAELVGISKSAVARYETEDQNIRLSLLEKFANALDTTASKILEETDEEKKKLQQTEYSKEEKQLIADFRKLSDKNKEKASERVQELIIIQENQV